MENENLTQQVSEQIADILKSSSGKDEKGDFSFEEMQSKLQSLLDGQQAGGPVTLPDIPEESIRIKEQSYENLSEEERNAKLKQDSLEYVTKVAYILTSSAPDLFSSQEDINKISESMIESITNSFESGSMEYIDTLSKRGDQAIKELEVVEVPRNMLSAHKKALQLFQYAKRLRTELKSPNEDPLAALVSLSKVQSFLSTISGFVNEVDQNLKSIGIEEIPDLLQ
ncbi:MAG: hypothetical protein IPL87_00750 [Candidatus Moraniibacteriota bacterium]|nr:MAG: hypothetical protein IPL87_00750 [Candidatus Moranbacteria bacterium]